MGLYTDYLFPWLMDWSLSSQRFQEEREKTLASASGDVLEIGFGTGLNLQHYPPSVTSLTVVDPARFLPTKVARRIAAARMPVTLVHLSAEHLPFEAGRFNCAVSTLTLCTIPDPLAALREIRRVLRSGGRFLFLEHGRSDDPRVARWQDRLNPLQQRLACGCNLNRCIDRLIEQAGLKIGQLARYQLPGVPRIIGEMYRGVADR